MNGLEGNIEEQLRTQGFYVSTTVGTSMRPMLRNRHDRVIIRPLEDGKRLERFDLPLYRRPDGKYILHRVIGVADWGYLIRGDNTYCVEKIPETWILGYVSEFYRGKRHVMTDNKGYRRYARFWNALYPVRSLAHRLRNFAARVKHKLVSVFRKK